MVIRWRAHEALLIALLAAGALVGYGWYLNWLSAGEVAAAYEAPFRAEQLIFHPYRNLCVSSSARLSIPICSGSGRTVCMIWGYYLRTPNRYSVVE